MMMMILIFSSRGVNLERQTLPRLLSILGRECSWIGESTRPETGNATGSGMQLDRKCICSWKYQEIFDFCLDLCRYFCRSRGIHLWLYVS